VRGQAATLLFPSQLSGGGAELGSLGGLDSVSQGLAGRSCGHAAAGAGLLLNGPAQVLQVVLVVVVGICAIRDLRGRRRHRV
jgi:hypothetical protein